MHASIPINTLTRLLLNIVKAEITIIPPSTKKEPIDCFKLKNFLSINTRTSTPPVEPPPTNVNATPAPTHMPPNTAATKVLVPTNSLLAN